MGCGLEILKHPSERRRAGTLAKFPQGCDLARLLLRDLSHGSHLFRVREEARLPTYIPPRVYPGSHPPEQEASPHATDGAMTPFPSSHRARTGHACRWGFVELLGAPRVCHALTSVLCHLREHLEQLTNRPCLGWVRDGWSETPFRAKARLGGGATQNSGMSEVGQKADTSSTPAQGPAHSSQRSFLGTGSDLPAACVGSGLAWPSPAH